LFDRFLLGPSYRFDATALFLFVQESVFMSPTELERAVASATGETHREIRRRGFQLLTPELDLTADGDDGSIVDWDALDAERPALFP